MRSSKAAQAGGRAIRWVIWVRLARIARLGVGGVIIGSFIGVYLGALFGLVYSAWVGALSPALDGALLGGVALALLGGAYGTVLGLTEHDGPTGPAASSAQPVSHPASSDHAPDQRPPAGRLESIPPPEMEHSHAR
jgi:hypothetical protein